MMSKEELRQMIRQRKQQCTVGESSAIIERLRRHPRFTAAHTLLLYSALPDEVPTQTLIDELAAQGKTVLLPRVVSATGMVLHRYTCQDDLQRGAFGIMEPTGLPFTDYEAIDVAVIPGMAFDHDGHRLGRGRGYYDRFLARVPFIYKIGICFPFQMVGEVPTSENDIPMDDVIS